MNIIDWDHNIFIYLNNLGDPKWDYFWMTITNKKTWIPLYLVIVFIFYKKFGPKKTVVIVLCALLMILCTDQISKFYKDTLIQRLRPCHDEYVSQFVRLVKDHCGGKYGFFSGHATNHMAIAVYVGLIFKDRKWVLPTIILWALMIAYSRIYIGVHYPLDIITGISMGVLFALLFYQIQRIIIDRKF